MSTNQKKKDMSKPLPRAFHLSGKEPDLEAIQFSHFLGGITAQFLLSG